MGGQLGSVQVHFIQGEGRIDGGLVAHLTPLEVGDVFLLLIVMAREHQEHVGTIMEV